MKNIILKIILILIFMVPFASLSNIWTKADGYSKYSLIHKIFTFNNEVYVSENLGSDGTFKYIDNEIEKLDTGFFVGKGLVHNLVQNENIIFASIGRKMYLSYDYGTNWDVFDTLDGNIRYSSVLIMDSTIYLQANEFFSLHKLSKGSDTLEKIYLTENEDDSVFADIMISKDNYIFAADRRNHLDGESLEGRFYISEDRGNSWRLSKTMKEQIAQLHYHNNTLLAFTSNNGLYLSNDNGETWIADTDVFFNVKKVISYNGKVFACGNQIYISSDNGVTWEVSNNNGLDVQSCKDIIVNNETLYFLTFRSIVYYSTDGGKQWIRKSPVTDKFSFKAIIDVRDTLFATGGYSIYFSTDQGNYWQLYSDSLYFKYSFLNDIYIKDSVFIVINDRYTSFFVSDDYGKTWEYNDLGIISLQGWISNVVILDNRILLISNKHGIYYSEDTGKTWKQYENEVLEKDTDISKFIRLNKNDIILYSKDGLYKTFDNGYTWIFEKTENEAVRAHYYSYWDGNNIYSLDIKDNQIFKSTDLGRSWTELEINLEPNLAFRSLVPYNGNLILLTTTDVFVSSNEGMNWNKYEVDFQTIDGKEIFFFNGTVTGEYIVCTSKEGIWRAKLTDIGITPTSVKTERNYLYTYPPYPLPAKSEVKVQFYWDINLPMTVNDISIYDLSGRKVQTKDKLRIDKQASHYGNLTWDCSEAQPGIYIINISHGTEERAVKVVVE